MATPKKKQTKAATPKKRRGSAPKTGRAPAPTQLEVKGAERPRIPILERLDKEMRAADSDQKAAADLKKAKAQSIARELRKLPVEYGGKYRTDEGRLLTVDVKDVVKSKATSKKPKRPKKNATPTPAPSAMPN